MQQITISKKRPGFIEFKKNQEGKHQLDDLWFMVGSRCNLTCSHCYVASSPTNDTLEQINLEDIKPYLLEAKDLGVKDIYFTGGEPFINKDIIPMIKESIKHANVTILTNATYPIMRHMKDLLKIKQENTNELNFRVSLDHFDEQKHDDIRGKGHFALTIKNTKLLCDAGFTPIITATAVVYEGLSQKPDEQHIIQKFKQLFLPHNIDVKLLPFNLEMGSNLNRVKNVSDKVFISEHCMTLPDVKPQDFQCHNGRTIEKINGKTIVYPCPIIYNDKAFELSENIKGSLEKVYLTHKACYDFCFAAGGKCTN